MSSSRGSLAGRQYLDPGDRLSGRKEPPELVTVLTSWGPGGGPRNAAVERADGTVQVIPFSRRLRLPPSPVTCPHCQARPAEQCVTATGRARGPHAAREKLAHAIAAHSDPALGAFFPRIGPCGLCGTPGLDQRHRAVDGIAGMLAAGEDPETVAGEHEVPLAAVEAVAKWAARWPGAWQ